MCGRGEEKRDGCRRRRNRTLQVHEVDEEGAVSTAGEEAGNDVGGGLDWQVKVMP